MRWQDDAVCAQTDPQLFFPDKGEGTKAAEAICAVCPVWLQCLTEAVEGGHQHGVWGGMSPRTRRKVFGRAA